VEEEEEEEGPGAISVSYLREWLPKRFRYRRQVLLWAFVDGTSGI